MLMTPLSAPYRCRHAPQNGGPLQDDPSKRPGFQGESTMKCGIFHTPYHPPSRSPREVFDWALKIAQVADEAGYAAFMIGEH
jgi:hypothetical protein